jgi:hypothetical protein
LRSEHRTVQRRAEDQTDQKAECQLHTSPP